MATQLNQVLTFAAVAPAAIVALPHNINVNDVPVKPDLLFRDNGDFSVISCTPTVLTVKNNGAGVATLNAWLEHQHTIDRVYGAAAVTNLTPQPFIPAGGGGGGGTPVAVIFDDFVPADQVNIRSDRATNQSPINNTKIGITNLGSDDGGGGVGATADYATIVGGLDCEASGDKSTAGGDGSIARSLGSTSFGNALVKTGADYATALGGSAVHVGAQYGFAAGSANARAQYASALGAGNANNQYSFAAGDGNADGDYASAFSGGNAAGEGSVAFANGKTTTAALAGVAMAGGEAIRDHQVNLGGSTGGSHQWNTSIVMLHGVTPGVGVNESVALFDPSGVTFGVALQDGRTYAFEVTLAAGGVQAGPTRVSRSIKIEFNARRAAGVSVITASGVSTGYGDAATATWTLVASVGAAPDRIEFTFDTGAGPASTCQVAAAVKFTETNF